LPDLLSRMTTSSAPTTEICIAIRTKFPFYKLFVGFINWTLESDMIARMQVSHFIERFLEGREHRSKWLIPQRRIQELSQILRHHLTSVHPAHINPFVNSFPILNIFVSSAPTVGINSTAREQSRGRHPTHSPPAQQPNAPILSA
jgi:hypothetical protein